MMKGTTMHLKKMMHGLSQLINFFNFSSFAIRTRFSALPSSATGPHSHPPASPGAKTVSDGPKGIF
jgi:hypothetical protein